MAEQLPHLQLPDSCFKLFFRCICRLLHHVDCVTMPISKQTAVALLVVVLEDVALVELFDGEMLG